MLDKALRGTVLFFVLSLAASAWAVSSSLWECDSRDEFGAGEPEDVSIMATGEVVLGPRAGVTTLDALYAWSLAEDSKGNIYAGTGNDGKVFKLSPKGGVSAFADLELQQVFALAFGENDVLYAAGFPGGKVYSIDPGGEISEYFDTQQQSVWSLCVGADARLFAATVDEGQIFSIEADGKGGVLYDSTERRILSLLGDTEGNLYAGSEPSGLVYRIDGAGRPFVFYDTDFETECKEKEREHHIEMDPSLPYLLIQLNDAAGGAAQREHCKEVAFLSREISRIICPAQSEFIYWAGLLHEIGKISLVQSETARLRKKEPLSPEENEKLEIPGVKLKSREYKNPTMKTELRLGVEEKDNKITMFLTYSTVLFAPETAERMLQHYKEILKEFFKRVPEVEVVVGRPHLKQWDYAYVDGCRFCRFGHVGKRFLQVVYFL